MSGILPHIRARARELRSNQTDPEQMLWRRLRILNASIGTRFRRQSAIGPYIADFADLGRRIVIEVDGSQHGDAADERRDAWLATQGFSVLRFWNNEVTGNIEGVLQIILDRVAPDGTVPPPPSPPHKGEGRHPADRHKPRPTNHLESRAVTGASPPPRGEGIGEGGEPPDF